MNGGGLSFTSSGSITPRQLYYLLVIATFPTEHLILSGPIIRQAGKDAVWAILLGAAAAVVPLLLSLVLLARGRGSAVAVARQALGGFGALLHLLCGCGLLLVTTNIWGEFVQLLHMDLLPHTRAAVILLFGLALVLYALPGGVEVAGRVSELLAPYGIATLVIVWLLAAPWYRIDALLPILPRPDAHLGAAAYMAFSFLAQILFVGYVGGLAGDTSAVPRAAWLALLTNTVLVLFATTAALLVFGPGEAAAMMVPALSVVRTIHYGFIVERIDTLMVPLWVALVSLKIVFWGLLGGLIVQEASGGRLPCPLVGAVALTITAVLSLRQPSLIVVGQWVEVLWYSLVFPLLALTLALTALVAAFGRRVVTNG